MENKFLELVKTDLERAKQARSETLRISGPLWRQSPEIEEHLRENGYVFEYNEEVDRLTILL